MKNPLALLLVSSALLLQSCAPVTLDDMRRLENDRVYSFETALPYERVYQKILERVVSCHTVALGTAMQLAQGQLYPEKRQGVITVGMHGALGAQYYQLIEVTARPDKGSRVDARYSMGAIDKKGVSLKRIIVDGSTECPPY